MPADLVSDESPLCGWQKATVSLCPHIAERETEGDKDSKRDGVRDSERDTEKDGSRSDLPLFSNKGTNAVMGAPPSFPHLNQITTQSLLLQIPSDRKSVV